DSLEKEKQLAGSKEEVLKLKYLDISIPYTPPGKGKYYLEVIVKDLARSIRYQKFHKFKI
ncbi:MAG: hypothetical protein GY940_15070, partial [bacterium]|nr:hypothetical protein [bacterium]